jgi:hypothetical protein
VTVPDELDALSAAGTAQVEYVGNYTAFQALRRRLGPDTAKPNGPVRARSSAAESTVAGASVVGAPAAPGMPVPVTVADSTTPAFPSTSALRVVVVHPDLLGTYGDTGNGRVLAGRAVWRDLPVELIHALSDAPLPAGADVYCIGGGEDGPQVQSAERLRDGVLGRAVDAGAVVLAVCAGFQVIGKSFPGADGSPHPGVGLLDVDTVKGTGRRAVGELAAEPRSTGGDDPVVLETLTGFENHSAVTHLGPGVAPLARVLSGVGNGTGDGAEGVRSGRIIATYLHGPALARNPSLADLLLAWATGTVPAPLADDEERALRAERLGALGAPGRLRSLVKVRRR